MVHQNMGDTVGAEKDFATAKQLASTNKLPNSQ
jgi:hypothetical protein